MIKMIKVTLEKRKQILDARKTLLKYNPIYNETTRTKTNFLHNEIVRKGKIFIIAKFKNKFYVTTLTKFEIMVKYKSIRPDFFIKIFVNKKCKQCKYFSACKLNFYTKNKNAILKNIINLNNNENYCNINKKSLKYKPI